jgi:cytochrome P450
MDFFIAGAQTTSTTLHYVFLMMLLYPDVQCRAHAQLDAVVGRNRLPELADRNKYVDAGPSGLIVSQADTDLPHPLQ